MVIIRGATTIERDDKESICRSVQQLLDEIFAENRLQKEETEGFLFGYY
jgi:chorismate mutase